MSGGSKIFHSQRMCIIILIISSVLILSASRGQEPEQSFQWTLGQWKLYNYEEPLDWPRTKRLWIGLAIRISEDTLNNTLQMDSLIHILYFDTTKLGVNDPTSLYRAISHIRLKPLDERARKNGDYGFKKTDDSSNISFRINKPDFIEFLIRNSIYRCSFHKSIRRFNSDDSNISPDGEPAILCKLIVYLPEYSYQDQLIQELEAKEYIFNVSKRKYKDPHPG